MSEALNVYDLRVRFKGNSSEAKRAIAGNTRCTIIPARGGSKRIPRKNIKDFHGKPMIAYSIEAALTSGCFDKVIVSTQSLVCSRHRDVFQS